jgi:hypothetical protein
VVNLSDILVSANLKSTSNDQHALSGATSKTWKTNNFFSSIVGSSDIKQKQSDINVFAKRSHHLSQL